ncbi:MAG: methyltransferase domain-containing protein [Candidatus Tantalella remota]|nr:methyltransferase domain-containing protein [Candidatus Tantalella remota]
MRTREDKNIDAATKKAWEENWKDVSVADIMEIFEYPRVKRHMEIYQKHLPRDKKIMEGGCGMGPYLIRLRELGYDVVGVDYNESSFDKIREVAPGIPLQQADVRELPFPDGHFGGYLSLGVIEHFTEGPQGAIAEAGRVLEAGGCFIVKVPRRTIFARISAPITFLKNSSVVRRFSGKGPKESYWEQYFKVDELTSVLEENGFKVIEVIPVDHEHGLMSFCSIFRDKRSYDGPNKMGITLAGVCERFMPWMAAPEMIFICEKKAH